MPGLHFVIAVMLITYGGPVAFCFYMDETTTVGAIPDQCSKSACPLPMADGIPSAGTAAATLGCGSVYTGTTFDSTGNGVNNPGTCQNNNPGILLKFEDFTTSYTTVTFDKSGTDEGINSALAVMADLNCDGILECVGYTGTNTIEDSSACSYWVMLSYEFIGSIGIEARCS